MRPPMVDSQREAGRNFLDLAGYRQVGSSVDNDDAGVSKVYGKLSSLFRARASKFLHSPVVNKELGFEKIGQLLKRVCLNFFLQVDKHGVVDIPDLSRRIVCRRRFGIFGSNDFPI